MLDIVAPDAKDAAEAVATKVKVSNASSHAFVQEMWELAKKLDATRLIEDMSVVHWEHLNYYAHGETDINSWHFYIKDYWKAKKHIQTVVDSTYPGSSFNYLPVADLRSWTWVQTPRGHPSTYKYS